MASPGLLMRIMAKREQKRKKQPKTVKNPETEKKEATNKDFDFGGLPHRDLKKNLGCG